MVLSESEKLIVALLCDISRRIPGKPDLDPDFVQEAFAYGNAWALPMQYPGIFAPDTDNSEFLQETVSMLDMWEMIEFSHGQLSSEDQKFVVEQAAPFTPVFRGFDGNAGQHYSVASMLIKKMGRFSRFAERDLNSHFPSADGYRRMLAAYAPMVPRGAPMEPLDRQQIVQVLKELVHPENR